MTYIQSVVVMKMKLINIPALIAVIVVSILSFSAAIIGYIFWSQYIWASYVFVIASILTFSGVIVFVFTDWIEYDNR